MSTGAISHPLAVSMFLECLHLTSEACRSELCPAFVCDIYVTCSDYFSLKSPRGMRGNIMHWGLSVPPVWWAHDEEKVQAPLRHREQLLAV